MKKGNEKLFIVLFVVSMLVNLRQCSDSQSHVDEIEALEFEISELDSEITRINGESNKKQEIETPAIEVREVNKFKPRVKVPVPADSIKLIPEIKTIDSLIVN